MKFPVQKVNKYQSLTIVAKIKCKIAIILVADPGSLKHPR